jgi:hypothetical protein
LPYNQGFFSALRLQVYLKLQRFLWWNMQDYLPLTSLMSAFSIYLFHHLLQAA